jgi:hypothetical protein
MQPAKPSESEEEYFKRQELERLREMRTQAARETAEAERTRLKQLHWMRCPKCGMELSEVAFRGVAVDACFTCGGMFFDQGEVDKLAAPDDPGALRRMLDLFGGRKSP